MMIKWHVSHIALQPNMFIPSMSWGKGKTHPRMFFPNLMRARVTMRFYFLFYTYIHQEKRFIFQVQPNVEVTFSEETTRGHLKVKSKVYRYIFGVYERWREKVKISEVKMVWQNMHKKQLSNYDVRNYA